MGIGKVSRRRFMLLSSVAPDALPTPGVGSTYNEMHVVPVPSGKPPIATALPARRLIIPTIGGW